jgi:myosin heavy subunit
MDKVLKVLVVLVLIVSAVALAFEMKLFGQRGELKGRNQMLARYVTQIAKTIEVPAEGSTDLAATDHPRMQVTEEQLKAFFVKDGAGQKVTTGPNTMDAVLKDIATRADLQFSRLNDTRSGLTQTRTSLTETKETLTKTDADLTQTKNTLTTTSTERDAAKTEVEQKKTQIEELTAKNEASEAKAEKQATELGKLTDKLSDRESQLEATKRYVEKLMKDLAVLQAGGDTNAPPPGLQGQIVFVNTNWSFVVVDVMPQAKVLPLTELTIQRSDKLVGKLRVSEVLADRNFAVCEILSDWVQSSPEKGDYVFY